MRGGHREEGTNEPMHLQEMRLEMDTAHGETG